MVQGARKRTIWGDKRSSSMNLFIMLCGYILTVLVTFSLLQFIDGINFGIIQVLSVALPIVGYLIANKTLKNKEKILTVAAFLVIILLVPFAFNHTYDLSSDGNFYHKTAIAFLKNGWNPMYETARDFQVDNEAVVPIVEGSKGDLWIEHYPKATWILAANIYNMTGNIESGKCITVILMLMLFILTYNCLKGILGWKWSAVIAVLLVLNPIVLSQVFTYYVDGIMGLCFAMEILLLFQIDPKKKFDKGIVLALTAVVTLFVNLKFTGLLCAGVIALVYYVYWLIINRKIFWLIFRKLTLMFALIFGMGVLIVGANSYVKNMFDHGNPLYPLMGEGKVDIVTRMQPKSFGDKNMVEKFVISTFAKTENVTYNGEPELKIPGTILSEEFETLYNPDTRMAGFGPMTSLIFILSGILLIIFMILFYFKEKQNLKYLILPLIAILVSTVMTGESWWARYVPQLYIIPVGVVGMGVYLRKYYRWKTLIPTGILTAVMMVNVGCFLYVNVQEVRTFRAVSRDIQSMKEMGNLRIKLAGGEEGTGYCYTLDDNGIKYVLDNNIPDEKLIYKYAWRIGIENDT